MKRIGAAILVVIFTWSCSTVKTEQRVQKIQVSTYPARAWVWQVEQGKRQTVGQSPVTLERHYQVKKKSLSPWWWLVVGLAGATGGVGLALYNDESDAGKYLTYAGSAALVISLVTYYYLGAFLSGEELPEPQPLVLGATLDGYLEHKTTVMVPGIQNQVRLTLSRDPDAPQPVSSARAAPPPSSPKSHKLIVAVFDVQDLSRKFNQQTLRQLTEYLSARLTQVTLYRVVPRDQLRARLFEGKKGTYRECYEESCQIELGKALAAQKSLSTKILKVGKRCAISSILYDFKTETAETSALVRTDCDEDSLMDCMDRVARQFSTGDYR
jgi:hypothetical protein